MLEARERVGGLQWTVRKGSAHTEPDGYRQVCTFDEGQYINAGPWRIPHSHHGVLNYCKELGVPLQVFLNESDQSYFYYEGTAAGEPTAGPEALARAKKLLLRAQGAAITPQLANETAAALAEARGGGEAREGIRSFLEKRKPSWQ